MNNLEKKDDLTIYERIVILISKVKTINNEIIRKKFTIELEKIYLEIKKIKSKYESLDSKEESVFFQEKQQIESLIGIKLDKLEKEFDKLEQEQLTNDDKIPKKIKTS